MKRLEIDDVTKYLEPRRTAEKHRPHVTERLWNLFNTYLVITIRPALLLLGEEKSVPANRWWEDELIKNALHDAGMPKGIVELASRAETPLATCLEAIEKEIRLEIRSAI